MKHAFTIVELLVSAAIITVLAAVLFPVLNRSRPSSINACLTNLNQIIAGANLYAADYNDHVLPWLSCSSSTQSPCTPIRYDVDRVWTSRLKPYVVSPIDPETGEPYFPPAAPYRCPDWNMSRLFAASDQSDCDGPGGLEGTFPMYQSIHTRSELFSTYGFVFGMCSFQEAQAGAPQCHRNGGPDGDYTSFGRDGTTSSTPMFAYPGEQLFPPSTKAYLGRTLSDIVRPSETAMIGDGGIYKSWNGKIYTVLGCEGAHMHWQHIWGGNVAMADGHATWLGGNPEAYAYIASDGFWIEKYFTFYE